MRPEHRWPKRFLCRATTVVRRACIALLGAALAQAAQAVELPQTSWEGETMGSIYTVKIAGTNLTAPQLDALKLELDDRLKEVNRQMSHYQPDSELSRFNRAPVDQPFPVSADFAKVLRLALDLHDRSGGAFDPSLGPVINLWGFGEATSQRKTPTEAEIKSALARTGVEHLRVTAKDELVKDLAGLQLNLSAIAKGFGVDAMAGVMRKRGYSNFYVSISGEVFASGLNSRGTNWQVGISAPVNNWREGDPVVTVLSISGRAVSTSGDYQKFFMDAAGHRQCHIFDPRTGLPVQHSLGSVSVVADNCTLADSLATTLFVLGADAGLKFTETMTNVAALFVVREADGKLLSIPSSRFAGMTGSAR